MSQNDSFPATGLLKSKVSWQLPPERRFFLSKETHKTLSLKLLDNTFRPQQTDFDNIRSVWLEIWAKIAAQSCLKPL